MILKKLFLNPVTWNVLLASKKQTTIVSLIHIVMMVEILVPIAFFAAAFGIVFVVISARNRERISMIEKGADPKDLVSGKPNVYNILKWALLLSGIGLGLFVGSLIETYTTIPEDPAYFASAFFFGGLGLVVAFLVSRKAE